MVTERPVAIDLLINGACRTHSQNQILVTEKNFGASPAHNLREISKNLKGRWGLYASPYPYVGLKVFDQL